MSKDVDLDDGYYAHIAADPLVAVRRRPTRKISGSPAGSRLRQAREFVRALELGPGRTALEVACGSGGVTCLMAVENGQRAWYRHQSAWGRSGAKSSARSGLSDRVSFQVVDAGQRLPFDDGSFDAVFSNDSVNHVPARLEMLREWHRVLRSGGACFLPIRQS